MDPSEAKKPDIISSPKKKSKLIPAILFFLVLATIGGISFYFSSVVKTTDPVPPGSGHTITSAPDLPEPIIIEQPPETDVLETIAPVETQHPLPLDPVTNPTETQETKEIHTDPPTPLPELTLKPQVTEEISICDKPTRQLDEFYKHLDKQPYIASFELSGSSQNHFTALIKKLLANPPQVTRESDDLYTILKNTAHFFRISGKDNILMMKGILDREKGSLEQILADYHLLIINPDCSTTTYCSGIDREALYEYACFFLNTMGGRLYLFRRDSLSRMVVTYYAVLLVDLANTENNNRHGIALKPAVDMLISEMETGGSTLKHLELYLDTLYDLKEKYQ